MWRLSVLGSGDAFNSGGALHSAYLIEHGGGKVLLECGASTLAALKKAEINPLEIDAVLVSHLHGDHFGGIPFLMLDYLFASRRRRPFVLAGPPSLCDRVRSVYAGLYKESHFHQMPFAIDQVTIEPGQDLELRGLRVEAFRVPHVAEPFCLGYRISVDDSAFLFSGDSAWTDEFVARSRDTDVFLCECCSLDKQTEFHTCYADILAHRDQLDCSRLVLTHLGADVRAAGELAVERAYDGMVLELGT